MDSHIPEKSFGLSLVRFFFGFIAIYFYLPYPRIKKKIKKVDRKLVFVVSFFFLWLFLFSCAMSYVCLALIVDWLRPSNPQTLATNKNEE